MTFDEALQLLGIARSDGVDAVRPAYLRLLKKHRPERDPDGFKRLRQALELVQGQSYQFASEAASIPLLATPVVRAPVGVALVPQDPLAAIRLELERTTDHAARLALAEATAQRLGSAEAYALWVEVAEQDDEPDASRHALRAAIDAGHGSPFMAQLREVAPDALQADELSVWLDEALGVYHPSWTALARTLLEQQRGEEAAQLAVRALQLGAQAGVEVHEWSSLYLALDLFARADPGDAAAFATQLLAQRDPYSRVEPVLYAALAELTRLHDALGELLTRGIAAALQANDPDAAASAIELFKHSEPRARKVEAIRRLKREAPTLYALYSQDLITAGLVWRVPIDLNSWRRILWAVLRKGWVLWLLIAALRVFALRSCDKSNGRDASAQIEISSRQVRGTPITECRPQADAFCETATRVMRAPNCTVAHMDALYLLDSAAWEAGSRLSSSARSWVSAQHSNFDRLCRAGATRP